MNIHGNRSRVVFTASMMTLAMLAAQRGAAQELEEIVVTAQKREQSVQDVPISITALSGDALAQSNVKDLFQAADFVPGMVFSRAPDDGLLLTFRGMGTPGRSQAFDQSVAVFLDGMFLGKGRLYPMAFFDVERMEFIKGTQSTLLGKNTSLGAISIVSRQPGQEFSAELKGGLELENGGYTLDAGVDIPMAASLAVRLAGHYNDLDGWVRNTVTGKDVPSDKDLGLRATAVFEPSEAFKGRLSYQYGDSERIGMASQIVDPALAPQFGEGILDDRMAGFTSRTKSGNGEHETESNALNLVLEWMRGGHTLTSQTSYIDFDLYIDDDFDLSPEPWIDFIHDEDGWQFSQEIRLASPTDRTVEYLAGAFYYRGKWKSLEHQMWGVPGFPPGTPIAGQLFNGPFTNDFTQKTETISGFAQATWHVSDRLRVTGGLRYTSEDKDVVFGRTAHAPLTIWNTVANPPFAPTPLAFSDSFVDGNANVQFDLTPETMAYVAYGHGTKTGGFVESNTVPTGNPAVEAFVATESANTVEAGIKSSWPDAGVRLNAALFHTRIKDFQELTFTGAAFITDNLPVKSRGAEVELTWQVTGNLRFATAWTYADAELKPSAADLSRGVVCNPCRMAQAPRWTGTMDVTYLRPISERLDLRANVHLRHRSSMYNQRGELFPADSFTPVDASLGIESREGSWGFSVVARNLFDEVAIDFSSPSPAPYFAGAASPGALRSITLMGWLRL